MTSCAVDALQSRLDAVLAGAETMELTLYEESGQPIGVMRPLTAHHLDQTDVIRKLTDWRNANMANFLTHFEATPARTRLWVQNVLLKNRGQMLWLIYDQNDYLVGHFGFKNLTSESVLLDNAMRGERKGHPKLFVFAGKRLVEWLWQATAVRRIDAYVMTENIPSIMMNRQIGFEGWKRHPLIKRNIKGDTHWNIGSEGQTSPHDRYCFTLRIEREGNTSDSPSALNV
jgi:RimJ/RimL family protein N-acetyltransferase